jgi:signal transduction histidine kinase/PAS domain-containing protein
MSEPLTSSPVRVTPIDRGEIREVPLMRRRTGLPRYVISIALTLLSFALTMLMRKYLGSATYLLFWPSIVAAAWLGGFGPALLASAGAVALVDYFVTVPTGTFDLADTSEQVVAGVFLLMSGMTAWGVSKVERARHQAALSAEENARLVQRLDEQGVELTHQLEESQAMQEELELSSEELAERTAEAEAAERFSTGVLESISDPFVVQDTEWRFRYINTAAGRIFEEMGRGSRTDLIGKIVWEVWPAIRGTRFETEMRRAADTRTPTTFEAFNPERGHWAELFCYPLPDGGLGTQWKDVTARKRAEEATRYLASATELLASSRDYQATLGKLAQLIVPHFADWCAISIVDENDTPQQLAVAHVDPDKVKWAEELNRRYPPDNSAVTGVPQVVRTGVPELYSEIPDELLASGAIDAEHLRITRELGLKSAMVVPLSTPDRILGAITVVSAESGRRYSQDDLAFVAELARRAALAVDNAESHKRTEEARRAAEAANEAKTQFLAVMSHELRTPLNAIGGYAELLLLGIRGSLTPDQQADLERIQRSQRNLLSLINDILNYAKLEAGHVEFHMEEVALHPLLMDLESLITPQLRARNLTYDYTGCDAQLTAWGDPEKIRQIILNLLSNAIKFTEPGGTVSITCNETGEDLRVIVKDTGVGIPADRLASVFEPFVQLERRLTSNHEGTGLGLAISRDLARGLGGDLVARSTMGEGSEFILTLRKARVSAAKDA